MSTKEFKTIDEQIEILKNRGLKIKDDNKAKQFLLENNYYRISGYSLTLRSHDKFAPTATFENIIDIYNFDHKLRHILLTYLEIIEVKIKSVYSYHFAKKYGAIGYLDENKFTDNIRYKAIIEKAELQKTQRLPHEAYLKHFVYDLNEDIPIWAYVDLLTISDISFLFKISDTEVKEQVAHDFNLTTSNGSTLLAKFLHSLTIIRNLCAHGSRLYNRLFEQKPCLNRQEQKLLSTNDDGSIDNAHLCGFIIIMKRLLSPENFKCLKNELIQLTKLYPFVNMKYYGFHPEWINNL